MAQRDIPDSGGRFSFGENWSSYAELIDETAIQGAEAGILQLIDRADLEDHTFLDIGCGAGIHSLAAARLGASSIHAVDLDSKSVETARALFERFPVETRLRIEETSVFDLDPASIGTFDIVYSWGVLHHTGNVEMAVRKAADMVASGGLFVFSLYRPTSLDWFWLPEKEWYAQTSPRLQAAALRMFGTVYPMVDPPLTGAQGRSIQGLSGGRPAGRSRHGPGPRYARLAGWLALRAGRRAEGLPMDERARFRGGQVRRPS